MTDSTDTVRIDIAPDVGRAVPSDGQAPPMSTPAIESNGAGGRYTGEDDYIALKRIVTERGLLDRQYGYYAFKIPLTLAILGASVVILIIADALWIHLLNAVFMAFAFGQLGLLAHDSGHRQMFKSPVKNDAVSLMVGILIGLDRSWWMDKHNRHHASPNNVDTDFDVNLPIIAFTEEQSLSKTGIARWIVRYQAFLFFPLLLVEAYSIRADSGQYILRGKNVKYLFLEALLVFGHLPVYCYLVFWHIGGMDSLYFFLLHQGLLGVYLGSIFATNHKGMLMVDKNTKLDFFRRQVLTTRNVTGSVVNDFVYGGLNYQIEHHLFPNMPRNKFKEAQGVIRDFCNSRSVEFYETGVVRSYREILGFLHEASAPLRRRG